MNNDLIHDFKYFLEIMQDRTDEVFQYVGEHLYLSMMALLIASAIAIPVG